MVAFWSPRCALSGACLSGFFEKFQELEVVVEVAPPVDLCFVLEALPCLSRVSVELRQLCFQLSPSYLEISV